MTEEEQKASKDRIIAWLNNPGVQSAAYETMRSLLIMRYVVKALAAQISQDEDYDDA